MNKTDISKIIAKQTGISSQQADDALDIAIAEIRHSLAIGETVNLNGLGTFDTIERPHRRIRSHRTGKIVDVPKARIVLFDVDASSTINKDKTDINVWIKNDERQWNLHTMESDTYENDYTDAVIDLSADMIVSSDSKRDIVIFNKIAEETYGYTQEEIQEHGVAVLYANQDEYEAVGEAMRKTDHFSGVISSRKKNGETFPTRINAKILRNEDGAVMGSVGYSRDLTEEMAAAQVKQELAVLKATEDMKKDIEQITRHDLKSPINGIVGFCEMLLQEPTLSEEHKESISLMKDLGYKTINMVNLSLSMVKMEKGSYQLTPKPMDMHALIKGILSDVSSQIKYKRLMVNLLINNHPANDDDKCIAYGEELLSYSLFANLIKNAVEASSRKQTIAIDMNTDDMVSIAIHNSAAVPEDIRETFFDKYATSGKSTGTGLGTYSAKLFTEAQHGKISMHSSDAEGTTIKVTLPING
ncbi:MAG: HU family DNA-binding protein [Gammaproteobacteria bacterium]|nr:HU family DNA-binding protein [Gammaproteobacteria bacterium]